MYACENSYELRLTTSTTLDVAYGLDVQRGDRYTQTGANVLSAVVYGTSVLALVLDAIPSRKRFSWDRLVDKCLSCLSSHERSAFNITHTVLEVLKLQEVYQ